MKCEHKRHMSLLGGSVLSQCVISVSPSPCHDNLPRCGQVGADSPGLPGNPRWTCSVSEEQTVVVVNDGTGRFLSLQQNLACPGKNNDHDCAISKMIEHVPPFCSSFKFT